MSPDQAKAAAYSAGYSQKMTVPEEMPPAPSISWETQIRADERRQVAIKCHEIVARAPTKADGLCEICYQLLGVPRPMDPTPEGAD
jgi:hypothetical protein